MTRAQCGVDFGTSNSSAALVRQGRPKVLPLDPANDNPYSLPSLLYITNESDRIVGRAAADAFIAQHVGREVVMEQVDLGVDIEGYVMPELEKENGYRPPEDSNVREGARARAMVEVNAPGRLFQSLKSSMRFQKFKGTEVFGQFYQIEELTAMILRAIKQKLDEAAGEPVERAVLGRPVRFSKDPAEDAVAEHRLHVAAELAGFKEIVLFYEPVAACVEYASGAERTQRLMVVDIGGGTCDVCIMEFGGSADEAARLSESRILSVSGVPVAGDAVDRAVIRQKLFPWFGSRARCGPARLPLPQYIFNAIADWQSLYRLNTEETINWLIANEVSSDDPKAIRALRYLIQKNYGYPVTRTVERAKKTLSHEAATSIDIHEGDIQISEPITREEFTDLIEKVLDDMFSSILDAEKQAGISPQQVDWVLTTGGTSLIPAVQNRLGARYGAERIIQRDTFTSVASGLATVAKYI